MSVKTWAVIPTNGRPFVHDAIDSLIDQVDGIVLVLNGGTNSVISDHPKIRAVKDDYEDLNISRWWNIGIDHVASLMRYQGTPEVAWNVLVVNDDVIAPVGLVELLSARMRACTAVLAYPNQHDIHHAFHRSPEPVNLFHRITGYCFMLRGESGLRLDESFVWWYGDDDLDWRARTCGGSLLVPRSPVQHRAPNGTMLEHPELHEQANRDRQTFINKWGRAPW